MNLHRSKLFEECVARYLFSGHILTKVVLGYVQRFPGHRDTRPPTLSARSTFQLIVFSWHLEAQTTTENTKITGRTRNKILIADLSSKLSLANSRT